MSLLFTSLIQQELDLTVDVVEPVSDIQDGENVVGELTRELQKLYTLQIGYRREAEELMIKQKYEPSEENTAKAQETMAKAAALIYLFWVEVKEDLHLWGPPGFGFEVRRGWKVVTYKQQHPLFQFLGGYGG